MATDNAMLAVLKGETRTPPPVWMMRQAGRYLPEYREKRREAGSFLDLCYNPDFAVEVTLQPIRRFDFDAAILFSDILVIPHALGRDLRFEEGRGPVLTPIEPDDIEKLTGERLHGHLEPVYEALRRLRGELAKEKALLGFCGAPWTVATYMIAGHGTPDQAPARIFGYRNPDAMRHLLNVLADHSADYLIAQIEAGADAVQIFDSWAGVLDDMSFEAYCIEPVARMVARVHKRFPDTPIIGFPKGAGARYHDYRRRTGVTALGVDWTVPLQQIRLLQEHGPVQGNLDPLRLLGDFKTVDEGVEAILDALADGPLIFNLGHGITPQTPIENVHRMVERVRNR